VICKKCGKKADVVIKRMHISLCREHYVDRIRGIVSDTIKKFEMIMPNDRVLVAVSGGKDSLALWEILSTLGYHTDALFIDLGIEDYSEFCKRECYNFGKEIGGKLIIFDLKKEFGKSLMDVVAKSPRKACSVCGIIKRYIMNFVAVKKGYDALATGHTLDDEVAFLASNILRWDIVQISRQKPVLESWHPMLAKKVKPLCMLSDLEMMNYALALGIRVCEEKCPLSTNAFSPFMKKILNDIENRAPGTKKNFYREFLKNRSIFERTVIDDIKIMECENCGMPTVGKYCSFCKIMGFA